MNKSILIGRLTADPSLKFLPGNGTANCTFVLAVDRRFSKDGKKEADFIPIVVWGKQAEATANYSAKGKLISIAGRIQTRNYQNKEGNKIYVTEVVAEEVQFIEWADKPSDNNNDTADNNSGYQTNDDITEIDDGSTPF